MSETVEIKDIITDAGTQFRAKMNDEAIAEYAEAAMSVVLPPIEVVTDGKSMWLVDGFHRVAAYQRIGSTHIQAVVRQGTLRDAIRIAAGANTAHGLRRTNADKRYAVEKILADPEWAALSTREVAKIASVSHTMVAAMRQESDPDPEPGPDEGVNVYGGDEAGEVLDAGEEVGRGEADTAGWGADDLPGEAPRPPRNDSPGEVAINERGRVDDAIAAADALVSALDELHEFGPHLLPSPQITQVKAVAKYLRQRRPHAVCPKCRGRGCSECRGAGWMPRPLANSRD